MFDIEEFLPIILILIFSIVTTVIRSAAAKLQNKQTGKTPQNAPRPAQMPVRTESIARPKNISTISSTFLMPENVQQPLPQKVALTTPLETQLERSTAKNAESTTSLTLIESMNNSSNIGAIKPNQTTEDSRQAVLISSAIERIERLPVLQKAVVWAEILKKPHGLDGDFFDE